MVKLTVGMDLSTIMVEGRPDLKITGLRGRPFHADNIPGQVYIDTVEWTRAYNSDGTRALDMGRATDAKIVSRLKVDVNLPIIAVNGSKEVFKYRYLGKYVPADGSEPKLKLVREGHSEYDSLEIYASTGKICSGSFGSALTFSNGPVVVKSAESILVGGVGVMASVTRTNGEITAISLP